MVHLLLFAACGESDPYRVEPIPSEALRGLYHAIPDATRVLFAVLGDAGTGSVHQQAVASAMLQVCLARGCQFVVGLGDNFYSDGVTGPDDPQFEQKFEEPYRAFGDFDFWMVMGNHDWHGNAQAQIDHTLVSERWLMPDTAYAIPGLPPWLRVVAYDSLTVKRVVPLAVAQDQVVRAALCADSTWKVLFGHHPAYSSGMHGDDSDMKQYVDPLMSECGAQLFLSGHDHHQELFDVGSYVQILQGAGARRRAVEKRRRRSLFALSRLGFSIVDVTEVTMSVSFYDTAGEKLYQRSIDQR